MKMRRERYHLLLREYKGRGSWRVSVAGRRAWEGGRLRGRKESICYYGDGWGFEGRGMGECRGGTLR